MPSSSRLHSLFDAHCGANASATRIPERLKWLFERLPGQASLGSNGNVARVVRQTVCYYELARAARRPGASACEVGFNAGHSAVLLLAALSAPDALYYGFDMGHPFTRRAVSAVNVSLFPGQLRLELGDSTTTVPAASAGVPAATAAETVLRKSSMR